MTSLAERIDFELARAREWRAGRLEPLADSEPDATTAGELGTDLAVRRAQRVLAVGGRSPGRVAHTVLSALATVSVGGAGIAGAQLARATLGDPTTPVNIVWFLLHGLAAQTAFLLLTALLLVPRVPGLGTVQRTLGDTLSLGAVLVRSALRLAGRGHGHPESTDDATARLRALAPLRPLAMTVSNAAWIGYNLGFLVAATLTLSAQHHAFGWQSTLVTDHGTAERALRAVTAPATIWPGPVTDAQVRVSRYVPSAARFAEDDGDPATALVLRQRWSTQLLAAVAGWGLLPRLLAFAGTLIWWRRARRGLEPDEHDPYIDAVVRHMLPAVRTDRGDDEVRPIAERAPGPAQETTTASPHRWFAASYLGAASGQAAVAALWGTEAVPGWVELPRLDSRAAEREALTRLRAERTSEPAALLLLADYKTTPDAALGSLIVRAREAAGDGFTQAVALTGGESFRATRLGRTEDGVERRRQVWLTTLAKYGVAAARVVDFDVANATPAARQALAATLGLSPHGDETANPLDTDLDRALDRVEELAPSWLELIERAQPADLEATLLRLAAEARREIDRCFQAEATTPGSDADLAAVPERSLALIRGALQHAVRSAEAATPEALDLAARSLGRMGRILSHARNVDPRLVLGGVVAGFVAGPIGGALAAGTAGLATGLSLASTLGTLGGALGGAVSMRLSRPQSTSDTAPSGGDRLGLPARTAVVRALVLANQGRTEPEIAEVLERLSAAPGLPASIATVDDVRSLTWLARVAGGAP